jgi:glycosyltransferase involved in cell wall biosynthesis
MLRIAILNNYLNTFGGGERATFALASALARQGHRVDVFTIEEKVPTHERIQSFFGPGLDGFGIVSVAGAGPDRATRHAALRERLAAYTVFVNHSAASDFPNPCPLGVYSVMFPFQAPGPWLSTYQHFLCNSKFTEMYTRRRWGMGLNTTVIYPAADIGSAAPGNPDRAREILAIGRFNWRGHTKNQDALVDAFAAVAPRLPVGWTLVLLGKLNAERITLERFAELERRCRKQTLPVRFMLDASDDEKQAALARAAMLWHGTGIGYREPEDAARMEHFGIAIVEAMAFGAVPLCYHLGGPREIVDHGETGFLFRSLEELGDLTAALANDPERLREMSALARGRAKRFDRDAFERAVRELFDSVVAS